MGKSFKKAAALMLLCCFINDCKTSHPPGPSTAYLDNSLPENQGLALLTASDTVTRPTVAALQIDSIDFSINNFRVGIETYLNYQTPVLVFDLPPLADYVEIMRCPATATLFGTDGFLQNLAVNASSATALADSFRRNDYWANAAAQPNCVLVISGLTDIMFEDASTPGGAQVYLLRACVDPSRVDSEAVSTANCSRQLGISSIIQFSNARADSAITALNQANQLREKVDSLGREIYNGLSATQNMLLQCQNTQRQRVVSNQQKEDLAIGLGVGIGIGIPAIGAMALRLPPGHLVNKALPVAAGAAFISTLAYAVAGPIKNFPQDAANCYTDGTATQTILGNDNSPLFCDCAQAIAQEARIRVWTQELQTLSDLYSKTVNAATTATISTPASDTSSSAGDNNGQ